MTPEEIADRVIMLKRNADKKEWLLGIGAGYLLEPRETALMIGMPLNDPVLADTSVRTLRLLMSEIIREVIEDCIQAVESSDSSFTDERTRANLVSAIRRHFGMMIQ